MDFRLLGPLEVHDGDRRVRLGAGKRPAVLALLLLRANEVVNREELIEGLWPAGAPPTAERAVIVYVSQLRNALEPERTSGSWQRLVTSGCGYELRLGDDELDAARFERGLRAGEAALASRDAGRADMLLTEALSLWRGQPLADFAYASFAQGAIARLEELRLVALERQAEARLALGRDEEVASSVEALLERHPLRERLWALRMRALYAAGRQADALAAYREVRRLLVAELALEPGEQLQALEGAILRHDPALASPAGSARAGARRGRRAAHTFVGRESELALLKAGLEDALAGRGRAFVVCGASGAGKSRLADELASCAKELGFRVLWARGWEAGGAPPLWPWRQLLRSYARAGASAEQPPDVEGCDSDESCFAVFDTVAEFLLRVSERQPLLLVLDDLGAADRPSLLLARLLVDAVAERPIVVLATLDAVERADEVAALAHHGATPLPLPPLTRAA